MSATVAHAEPRTRWTGSRPGFRPDDERDQQRRHIEIVATRGQRRARPRTVYAVLVIGGLFTVLLAQLLLSIGLSDGAYAIQGLQQKQRELGRTEQVLTEDLERLSSPQNLAANARAMGMVSNAAPVYLRLSDGVVLGAPIAATADASAEPLVGNVLLAGVPVVAAQAAESAAAESAAAAAVAAAAAAAEDAAAGGTAPQPGSVPLADAAPAPLSSETGLSAPITR